MPMIYCTIIEDGDIRYQTYPGVPRVGDLIEYTVLSCPVEKAVTSVKWKGDGVVLHVCEPENF